MALMKIIRTHDDHPLTLLRVVLGLVFFAHGAQKVLGWFGGAGFDQTMRSFTLAWVSPRSLPSWPSWPNSWAASV